MDTNNNLTSSTRLAIPVGPHNAICSQTSSTPTAITHNIGHYEQVTKALPDGAVYDCVTMKSITITVPAFRHSEFSVHEFNAIFVKSLSLQTFESFEMFWMESLACLQDINWHGMCAYSTVLL
jgi:hypothetical protein